MRITGTYQTVSYKGLLGRKKEKQNESVPFHANPIHKQVSAGIIISLLTAGYVNIVSSLKRGKEVMSETNKFIDIREDFSKEA